MAIIDMKGEGPKSKSYSQTPHKKPTKMQELVIFHDGFQCIVF